MDTNKICNLKQNFIKTYFDSIVWKQELGGFYWAEINIDTKSLTEGIYLIIDIIYPIVYIFVNSWVTWYQSTGYSVNFIEK